MSTTSSASSVVGESASKERSYFGSDINLQMRIIQESLLRREHSDRNNSVQKLSKMKYGKATLFIDINRSGGMHWGKTSRDDGDSGKKTGKRGIYCLE
jgi:hypothetical protein